MPKTSTPQVLAKMEAAGIKATDFYAAVKAIEAGGLQAELRSTEARNRKRRKAADFLKDIVEKRRALFHDVDDLTPGDADVPRLFEEVVAALAALRGGLRLNGARRTNAAIARATRLGCRHMGELAALLSAKGIGYRQQALLLLTPPPGGDRPFWAKKRSETPQEAVTRVASQLKTQASRARGPFGDDERALIAALVADGDGPEGDK